MVRLSVEQVKEAAGFTNPLKERELDLRSSKIDKLENLGLTLNQYDTLDLTDNFLRSLSNFPMLPRLKCILAHNNSIASVDVDNVKVSLPSLASLMLTNNNISSLDEVRRLQKIKSLRHLSLHGNPVTASANYRKETIKALPFLRTLDHCKVTREERESVGQPGLLNNYTGSVDTAGESSSKHNNEAEAPAEIENEDSNAKKVDPKLLQQAFEKAITPEALAALEEALRNKKFDAAYLAGMESPTHCGKRKDTGAPGSDAPPPKRARRGK